MQLVFFLFLFFLGTEIKYDFQPHFIVWNVGQGSWSTYIHDNTCYHFDLGGERSNMGLVKNFCGQKRNQIFITHLDYDHINLIKRFSDHVKELCIYYPKKNNPFVQKFKNCFAPPSFIKVISLGSDKSRNASSIIYLIDKKILITGDSTMAEEKKWAHHLPSPISILIAGHHGSNTSTSDQLLKVIKPRWAIFSARKKKYGHPHPKVTKRLLKQKIPYLSTEDFGNIYFY